MDKITKHKTSILKKQAAILLAAGFLFGLYPFPNLTARANDSSHKYLVKLKSADAAILYHLGTNVAKQFGFSGKLAFQNIYSFNSIEPLAELQTNLSGLADFVQIDEDFVSASVLDNSDLVNGVPSQPITVNDPGFTSNAMNIDKQWAIPKAGFDYAWNRTTGSGANVVAIIDTGVDATHEDLQNITFVPGYNFVSNQPITGRVNSDDNGHGTLVAGILGATPNNGIGIVGTNWAISIMPLKALDSTGKGDSSSIAQAIVWATDHGANFINLSLGGIGFGHDVVLINAITYAYQKNVLVVAAAGNDMAAVGGNLDNEPVYPVCDDGDLNMVLGVAATDQYDLKASFSNYGRKCIDVSAPGKRILSTINFDPVTKVYAPNSYAYVSGTSVAVPFVVGQAALIRVLNPNATMLQIRDQIISTTDAIDSLNSNQCGGVSCSGLLGAGRIDVRQSLDKKIVAQTFQEGDLVTAGVGQPIYEILSGQKRRVSSFVLRQKFPLAVPKIISQSQLSSLPDGPFILPLDGTLVKSVSSATVYMISHGQKQPVTYQVFLQRQFIFSQVTVFDDSEVNVWSLGSFLAPVDGTLVRSVSNPTVFWVIAGVLHPINYNFYIERGLQQFSLMAVSSQDLNGFAKGEAYIR